MNGVYCLTFPNGKRYVGKGVNIANRGINVRWNSYKKLTCEDQPKLYNALKKYGPENVKYEVVLETSDDDNAKRSEMYLIDVWNLQDDRYGYNMTDGGDGSNGYKHSPEAKENIKKAKSNISSETRRRMSESAKIRIQRDGSPTKGGLRQETKDKISKTRKERIALGIIKQPKRNQNGLKNPNKKSIRIRNTITNEEFTGMPTILAKQFHYDYSTMLYSGKCKEWIKV